MNSQLGTLTIMETRKELHRNQTMNHSEFPSVEFTGFESTFSRFKTHALQSGTATIARAPGRLDVLGGVADYSGSLVMEGTLAVGTWVAAQPASHREIRITSVTKSGLKPFDSKISFSAIFDGKTPLSIEQVASNLTHEKSHRWSAYLVGAIYLLIREGYLDISRFEGCNLFAYSDVPIGAGVSSSAALEVATAQAIAGLYNVDIGGMAIASLCQRVENNIVGAPCGIMDQVTCSLGKNGTLLELDCRPHDLLGYSELPKGWKFIGIDSGVKHSVGGSSYGLARTAAFMGLEILKRKGIPVGDYLCNLDAQQWNACSSLLPAVITGDDFLKNYGGLSDSVSNTIGSEKYFVRACSEHPILENERVRQFKSILSQARNAHSFDYLRDAGQLMLEAHTSYSDRVNLGCAETDTLVSIAMSQGPNKGIFGAKITGGGSGGTVALLCFGESKKTIDRIRREYTSKTGRHTQLMTGSSPGAWDFGTMDKRV